MKSNGPGKYNDACTLAREAAGARGAVLMIINGTFGHGFEVQLPEEEVRKLPEALRAMADSIEKEIADE